jgi:putative transposase
LRKSFLYRLYPNKEQNEKLSGMLDTARSIYNSALAERKYAYRAQHKSLNYYDQASELKELRQIFPEVANLNCAMTQDMLRRLDKAFKAFYNRKAGERIGFPRFKGRNRFSSVTFPVYGDGIKLHDDRLYVKNVGLIKFRMHRLIEGDIKTVAIKHDCDKWYVIFSNEVDIQPLPYSSNELGIDLGLESFAITSDNEFIENPRYLKHGLKDLRKAQRFVARKKRGSKNRRKAVKLLAKQHLKVRNQRKDFVHKQAREIVNNNGFIAVEDLQIKNMVKNHHLAQSIHDAGWGMFINALSYKAEWAGRTFVKVNPNGTSQICSNCGAKVPKDLSVRIHNCPYCGIVLHRDYNSALNIKSLGRSVWDLTWNSGSCVSQEAVCFS